MEEDSLCSPGLLPFLRQVVVVIAHDYLQICPVSKLLGLLRIVEAVGGSDNPPVADEGAATEVTLIVRVSEGDLPRPGAGHCLETSINSVETLSFTVKRQFCWKCHWRDNSVGTETLLFSLLSGVNKKNLEDSWKLLGKR